MSLERKCTPSSDDVEVESPSTSGGFHGHANVDFYESNSSSDEKSLEDTLSLTCDEESLASRSMEESSDDAEFSMFRSPASPAILRKRLLPMAPSPISGDDQDGDDNQVSYRNRLRSKTLWKGRSAVRLLCFSASILAYMSSTTLTYPSLLASIRVRGVPLSQEAQTWSRFHRRKGPKMLQKISKKASNSQYTIRIKGHRLDLVLQSLDYHAQCPSVKTVQVDWTDPTKPRLPRSVLKHKSGKVEALSSKSSTAAVFLLDEDVLLKCDEIERAFQEWRLDPTRLVGFYPYHHQASAAAVSGTDREEPFQARQVSLGQGAYSMMSDQAVFVHHIYLRNFPEIPDDKCQRLGLSIAVSSITFKPPVAVMSNPLTTLQRSKRETATLPNVQCQKWMETIGDPKLKAQVATIVGHERN